MIHVNFDGGLGAGNGGPECAGLGHKELSLDALAFPYRRRAEHSSGEHSFKHRAQWVFVLPSPSSGERAQWVPLSLFCVCQSKLTKLTEFAAELSAFSLPEQYSRNSTPPVSYLIRTAPGLHTHLDVWWLERVAGLLQSTLTSQQERRWLLALGCSYRVLALGDLQDLPNSCQLLLLTTGLPSAAVEASFSLDFHLVSVCSVSV